MKPGPELNELVARHVMVTKTHSLEAFRTFSCPKCPSKWFSSHPPDFSIIECKGTYRPCDWRGTRDECMRFYPYSTEMKMAWVVAKRFYPYIKIDGRGLDSSNRSKWAVSIWVGGPEIKVYSDTAEHAICIAALKAVGVEVPV